MKKRLLLIFLSFTFFVQISAQTPPRTYVITTDSATQQFLDNTYWQVLNDKNGQFTIDEVQKEPLAHQFGYFTKNSDSRFTRTTWFRFNLKNNTGKNLTISIASDATKADFYIPDSNGFVHRFLTGRELAWHRKDGFKKVNAIPFEIKQGRQITIYLKTVNRFAILSTALKFPLFNTERLEQSILKDYQDNYTNSTTLPSLILCGIFLLACIFNLLLFFTVRGKVYLYFSLFSLFATLSYADPLYNPTHVNFSLSLIIHSISVLWVFFLLQFVRHYLHVPEYHPRWDKWLIVVLGLFLTTVIASIFITTISSYYFINNSILLFIGETASLINIIFQLSFIITIFIFLLKHSGGTKVFLIGILPFVLDTLCFTLLAIIALFSISLRITLIGYADFNGYLNGVCLLWTSAVISWDLFKQYAFQETRITQEKLEKEQLAKEKEIEKSELIALQKIELEKQVIERTSELKQSLEELKSTQSQLIQSEKMASLGELTAGIAHEIQNPLNFVNNFSDVNKELLEELKEEADKGNIDEVKAIANDVIENEEKINHHGKRADAIVKGMLEHSRTNSGIREPTDINVLCDEYLRLSYHGLRAKDKSFNATLNTDFDMDIGKINIVPQDIGRVILNLINNAFYAVNEKKKSTVEGYEPIVLISTKKIDGKVRVRITDNGNGIPQNIVDKIFQPFFTTKPTGQGTGLGLSLSYDIIKTHHGDLNVETKEKEGSTFIIQLPTN